MFITANGQNIYYKGFWRPGGGGGGGAIPHFQALPDLQ